MSDVTLSDSQRAALQETLLKLSPSEYLRLLQQLYSSHQPTPEDEAFFRGQVLSTIRPCINVAALREKLGKLEETAPLLEGVSDEDIVSDFLESLSLSRPNINDLFTVTIAMVTR